jgi:hypothetical protein
MATKQNLGSMSVDELLKLRDDVGTALRDRASKSFGPGFQSSSRLEVIAQHAEEKEADCDHAAIMF